MAVVRLPDHSHCEFCGDPIPFGKVYCDEKCRKGAEEATKRDKWKDVAFYGVVAVAILILVYGAIFR